MSQGNIDLAKQLYDLFGRGDIPGVLGLFDPQIEPRATHTSPMERPGRAPTAC